MDRSSRSVASFGKRQEFIAISELLKNADLFAAMTIINPRANYYFIFYSEQENTYWVIPSLELIEIAYQNKTGKNKGKYTINLAGYSRKTGEASPNPKFAQYENASESSEKALKEVTEHGIQTGQTHP